jgi:chromosome segregation ATPase
MAGNKTKEAKTLKKDFNSPATKLLDKRRELYKAYEDFETQKEEYKKKEEEFKQKEQKIRDSDSKIQQELIMFCKFLQDNENKRLRAERRLMDETKARQAKENEILEHLSDLEREKKKQDKIKRKVTALQKYDEYLATVIANNQDQYQDINELLKRHETLQDNKSSLEDEKRKLELIVEDHKNGFLQIQKEKSNQILLLNNENSQLQKKNETLEQERSTLETALEGNSKGAFEENVFFGKIFMAIDN